MVDRHGALVFSSANRGSRPKVAQRRGFRPFLALANRNSLLTEEYAGPTKADRALHEAVPRVEKTTAGSKFPVRRLL
jgi:hypothetical protein